MQKRKEPQFEDFDSFEKFFDQAERRSDYWEEIAKMEFTREVLSKMNKEKLSRAELAARLEVQPGMVTRLLSGRNNFELSTMVRMAMAVNCRFLSHLEPLGTKSVWIDVSNLQNFFLSNDLVSVESFNQSSPGMILSHFTTLTNCASDENTLAENSKDWRKKHTASYDCAVSS